MQLMSLWSHFSLFRVVLSICQLETQTEKEHMRLTDVILMSVMPHGSSCLSSLTVSSMPRKVRVRTQIQEED
jgi:hypothetical protein